MYPEYALIGGKEYKIDTSYRTAIRCFQVIDDETITDYERGLAIIYLLFDFIPKKNLDKFLDKAKYFLECGDSSGDTNSKKDMDFTQDRKYINSSFMSDYHIDLSKEDMHFWQFVEYIEGLTENSSLNRVRELRNFDTSKITDIKEKEKIQKAQSRVSLKKAKKISLTQEQIDNANEFCELAGIEERV